MRTYKEYRELLATTSAEDIARQVALPVEAREYQGQRAGFVTRMLSGIIDVLVVIGIVTAINLAFIFVRFLVRGVGVQVDWALTAYLFALGFVIFVLYMAISWRATGRSIGAQIMGLRVVNNDGLLLRAAPAFLRALSLAVFPIGLVWVVFSGSNRSIQDVLLGSSVIYDWTYRVPKVERNKKR